MHFRPLGASVTRPTNINMNTCYGLPTSRVGCLCVH